MKSFFWALTDYICVTFSSEKKQVTCDMWKTFAISACKSVYRTSCGFDFFFTDNSLLN